MCKMPDRAWVEIDLDAIANNLVEIKRHLGDGVRVNGVIKADGYGHGAIMTAQVLCEKGIDMLSVATLDEALQLRKVMTEVPILVLGYTEIDRVDEIVSNNIIVTIFDRGLAEKLSDEAVSKGCRVTVHIKLDTGMNRIGFHYTDEDSIFRTFELRGLDITGTFTHFSTADEEDSTYTELQYKRFCAIIGKLRSRGMDPGICHVNNSGGIMMHGDKSMDMVRAGLILYGLYPSEHSEKTSGLSLANAMTMKARIIKVKTIEPGEHVSYGNNFITGRSTRVATISCGYADGYSRVLSGKAEVLVNGQKAPVIGNICMDMCMADITDIEGDVEPGDSAILFNNEITAGQIASMTGTISYEIVCRIGMRIPRVYLKDGRILGITNYLL